MAEREWTAAHIPKKGGRADLQRIRGLGLKSAYRRKVDPARPQKSAEGERSDKTAH